VIRVALALLKAPLEELALQPDPSESPAASLGTEVLVEFRALTSLLSPRLLAYLVVVIVAALALRRSAGWLVKVVWRLGVDPHRHLSRVKGGFDLLVLLLAAFAASQPLFVAVPLISAIVVAVVGLIGAIALPEWIQNIVAGLSLTMRGQFREGDRIELAAAAGAVERMGLFRTSLRATDGSLVTVPNRSILRDAVRIGVEEHAVPVVLQLPDRVVSSLDARDLATRIARLSPYRRAGSQPRLERGDQAWTLTIQTWATADASLARNALEKALTTALGQGTEP
jgi:hypothetical protein